MSGTAAVREEDRVETLTHSPRLVLEHSYIEGNCLAPPPIAGGVVLERRNVAFTVLEGAPKRKVQMRLIRIVAALTLHEGAHGCDFAIVEHVGFQVRKTPINLA